MKFLVFASALTPLVFFLPQYFPFVSPKAFFLIGVSEVVFVCLVWLVVWRQGFKWSPIMLALAGFIGIQILAAIHSIDPIQSFWSEPARMTGVILLIHLFVLFLAMVTALPSLKNWTGFFAWNLLIGLAVNGLEFISHQGLIKPFGVEATATFGNSTLYGTYLLFLAWMAVYVFFNSSKVIYKALAVIGFILSPAILVSIGARAAFISLIGSLVLAACLWVVFAYKQMKPRIVGLIGLAMLTVVFLFVSVGVFINGSPVQEAFIESTTQSRLIVWGIAGKAFLEKPLLGWGPEMFEYVFFHFYNPCFGSVACSLDIAFDRAHNVIFELLSGSGILGLGSYLVLFAVVAMALWRPLKSGRNQALPSIIIISALVAYAVQNFTGFDSVTSLYLWVVFLAFASVSTSLSGECVKKARRVDLSNLLGRLGFSRMILPIILFAMLPFSMYFFIFKPWMGFWHTARALDSTQWHERLGHYQQALKVSSAGLVYRCANLAHETNVTAWKSSLVSPDDLPPKLLEEMELSRACMSKTLVRVPEDLKTLIEYGRLAQVRARLYGPEYYQKAEEIFHHAIDLHPLNPHPVWGLASVLLEQGKVEEAITYARQVLERDRRVLMAHTRYAVAVKFSGDEDRLSAVVARSEQEAPQIAGQLEFILKNSIEEQPWLFLGHFY